MSEFNFKQENQDSKEGSHFFTVKNFAKKNREKGTWPSSEAAIWALRAGVPQNGFEGVFITIGRRVLIDEQKFWAAVSSLQGAKKSDKKVTIVKHLKEDMKGYEKERKYLKKEAKEDQELVKKVSKKNGKKKR